ncbi:sporulation integral membrane protein YtvI [Halobacillus fulvus]|nr:sporulation integral membrane protein YtvI [Halobacillus fulvus]
MDKDYLSAILRGFLLVAVFIVFLLLSISLWKYLFPFLAAFVVSYALQPFINLLVTHLRIPRFLSVLLLMTLFFLLAMAFFVLIVAEILKGIQYISMNTPGKFQLFIQESTEALINSITPIMNRLESYMSTINHEGHQSLLYYLEELKEKASETGGALLQSLLETITHFITTVPASFTSFLMFTLSVFFFSKDWPKMIHFSEKALSPVVLKKSAYFSLHFKQAIAGIVKAQCILIFISMILIYVGLKTTQTPHALTITFLCGLVDAIPLIGTGIIFLPWAGYQLATGSIEEGMTLIILYIIVLISRQLLEPKILATEFGVHPLVFLIGLFLGYQLWGISALWIAPLIIVGGKAAHTIGLFQSAYAFVKGSKNPPLQ